MHCTVEDCLVVGVFHALPTTYKNISGFHHLSPEEQRSHGVYPLDEVRPALSTLNVGSDADPVMIETQTYGASVDKILPDKVVRTFAVVDIPPEQVAAVVMANAKTRRRVEVDTITVTTASGKTFDGNEEAQGRMARAILAMTDSDTLPWVLADNSVVAVARAELQEALRLAGMVMAEIWVRPYQ